MKRTLWQACLVTALGSITSGVSLAQTTTDCSTIAEDMARLKCYDEQAARQKKKTPAPASRAPAPAQPPSSSNDFGLDAEAIRKKQAAANASASKGPDQIVSRVKAVETTARGEYRIALEDGQVWEETQHSANGIRVEVGDTVTIKHGLLGSYFLSSHAAGLALRVKRID